MQRDIACAITFHVSSLYSFWALLSFCIFSRIFHNHNQIFRIFKLGIRQSDSHGASKGREAVDLICLFNPEDKNQRNSFKHVKTIQEQEKNQIEGLNTWLNEKPNQTQVNIVNQWVTIETN